MTDAIYTGYEKRVPSEQTIADIFAGTWKSKLPGLTSGDAAMFEDARPAWFADLIPDGMLFKSVLDLGPFEAYQTMQLERMGAASIDAVEGNRINFLKCLCLKEIYALKARFWHGDIMEHLRKSQNYDVVWASGILYHMSNPVEFLDQCCRIGKYVYIWTNYFDLSTISEQQMAHFITSHDKEIEFKGRRFNLHARSYNIGDYEKNVPLYWEGAPEDLTYWMEIEDIRAILDLNGFDVLGESVAVMDPPGLPCMQIAAVRREIQNQ